jgi:ribosomal protein S18 acetylase RimI-like enzyme
MKDIINTVIRFWWSLKRPSKAANLKRLRDRGESLSSFNIREATEADITALATLHVQTWNETYPDVAHPPSFSIRERQWNEIFSLQDDSWFCFLVEQPHGKLVGFALGKLYNEDSLPQYAGELNKIYVLQEYQRVGLGTQLFCHVAGRFIDMGINSMVLFGIPQNPSCDFHQAVGGVRLLNAKGEFDGGYGWPDLQSVEVAFSDDPV